MSRKNYYSGDLLFSVEILRNVTDTFKRATYIPAPDDVQVCICVMELMAVLCFVVDLLVLHLFLYLKCRLNVNSKGQKKD